MDPRGVLRGVTGPAQLCTWRWTGTWGYLAMLMIPLKRKMYDAVTPNHKAVFVVLHEEETDVALAA